MLGIFIVNWISGLLYILSEVCEIKNNLSLRLPLISWEGGGMTVERNFNLSMKSCNTRLDPACSLSFNYFAGLHKVQVT